MIDLTPEQPTPRVGREQSRSGDFIGRSHSGSVGTIEYMLYRPAATAPNMPLVVMLHGCTQTPEDCARGTGMNELAEELGFLVAYPRQTQAANQQRCWNWFRPGDQARGRGEPALIAGIVRDVIAAERIDAERVYVAGLSAGGAAAAIMADAYPDLFAAVGVHSGLACGAARDLPSALTAMNRGAAHQSSAPNGRKRFVPVITFHGDRDRTVIEANAREIVHAASRAAGVTITVVSETGSSGGRRFTRALSQDAAGRVLIEQWTIAGGGHAWSGGNPAGSHADAAGPDASRAMLSFFERHRLSGAQ
ncbi:extracellular catalytic domain type 1 short-chain-length polyhydroxyalkanoate depolymerase [Sphingomonas guangdongensis]|uniref:extracellular catalytic domain type 1 short-chain-length polyhydroxyalkanoate depolymerase n=1 Tax=Sphingomonas guangdongensis TaxID=1141890 RepID=UPI001C53B3E9|nr:PHB depolymerase family esterase [Sphingomonas guangdongensis]